MQCMHTDFENVPITKYTCYFLETLLLTWGFAGYSVISWTFEWSLLLSASSYTRYSHDWRTRLGVSGMVFFVLSFADVLFGTENICKRLSLVFDILRT